MKGLGELRHFLEYSKKAYMTKLVDICVLIELKQVLLNCMQTRLARDDGKFFPNPYSCSHRKSYITRPNISYSVVLIYWFMQCNHRFNS